MEDDDYCVVTRFKGVGKFSLVIEEELENYIAAEYMQGGVGTVSCCTEYKRDGVIYRAHPDYRSQGKWEDWVLVQFDTANGVTELYPSRLLCFVLPDDDNEERGWHAIVQCTVNQDIRMNSVCVTHWNNEMDDQNEGKPLFRSVPVETLDGVTFMFNSNDKQSIQMKSMEQWAHKFASYEDVQ